MEFSEKLSFLRKQKGLTLEDVGKYVGVGKSTVHKWESGDIANIKRDKIAKLANCLDTTPDYLMGWNDSDAQSQTAKLIAQIRSGNPADIDKLSLNIDLFNHLSPEGQDKALAFVEFLCKSEQSDKT